METDYDNEFSSNSYLCVEITVNKIKIMFAIYSLLHFIDVALLTYYCVSSKVEFYLQMTIFAFNIVKLISFASMILLAISNTKDDIYLFNNGTRRKKLLSMIIIGIILDILCTFLLLLLYFLQIFQSEKMNFREDMLLITLLVLIIPNLIVMILSVKVYVTKSEIIAIGDDNSGGVLQFDKNRHLRETGEITEISEISDLFGTLSSA